MQVPLPFQLSSGMYSYFPTQSSARLRCGGIVGDVYASASKVDQLVSLLRLLLVPLVVDAGDGARLVDGLSGVCRSTAKNE